MKSIGLLPTLAIMMTIVFVSCGKLEDRINSLEQRISELEDTRIPSIDEQVTSIKKTIIDLGKTDSRLQEYISSLEEKSSALEKELGKTNAALTEAQKTLREEMVADKSELSENVDAAKSDVIAQLEAYKTLANEQLKTLDGTIDTLKIKDNELQQKITDLQAYVNSENNKMKDWATGTFATIEQQNAMAEIVASIKTQLETLNTYTMNMDVRLTNKTEELSKSLSALDESTKQQISELTAHCNSSISTLKSELTESYTKLVASEISKLETSMQSWVNDKLSGYYTIEETDAKLSAMQSELNDRISSEKAYLVSLITNLETTTNKKISTNASLITSLRNDLSGVQQNVAENAGKLADDAILISQNTQAISRNSQKIADNTKDISAIQKLVETNQGLIYDNAAKINEMQSLLKTLNDSGIKDYAETIVKNSNGISANASMISKNAAQIQSNFTAIVQDRSDIQKLKEELEQSRTSITEAYTAAISKAINDYNGVITSKLAENIATVNVRIDNEVKSINKTISDIQSEIKNIKDQISELLDRIQSVVFIPQYEPGKSLMKKVQGQDNGVAEFNYRVSPASQAAALAEHYKEVLSVNAVYADTKPIAFEDLPIISCTATSDGVLSLKVSGKNLSEDYFNRISHANASLVISDGRNTISTDYVKICALYYSDHTFTYKTSNRLPIVMDDNSNVANNSYEDGLGMIAYKTKIDDFKLIDPKATLSEIISFPLGITRITLRSTSLQSVSVPETVVTINDSAFKDCSSLTSVTFHDNILRIEKDAFNKTNISSLKLPANLKSIGSTAFYGIKIKEVVIPEQCDSLGQGVFNGCSLKKIVVKSRIIFAGKEALGASSLIYFKEDFLTGRSLSSHWNNAFNFTPPGIMVIGENVSTIDGYYDYNTQNTPITVYALSPKFKGSYFKGTLYVPENLVDYYQSMSKYKVMVYDFNKDPNNVLK